MTSAAYALGRIGPAAKQSIPALTDELKHRDKWRRAAAAAGAVASLGLETKSAAPTLCELLKDERSTNDPYYDSALVHAAEALWRIEKNADLVTPVLIQLLGSDWSTREYSARVLKSIGGQARGAVPALRRALSDSSLTDVDARAGVKIAEALWEIDAHAETLVPVLVKGLEHSHYSVRRDAAAAIGIIGPPALSAVPALTKAVKDVDWASGTGYLDVRLAACQALWKIDRRATLILPTLVDVMQNSSHDYRRQAALIVATMGSEAKPALPALIKTLRYDEIYDYAGAYYFHERSRAAPFEALVSLGPVGISATPALQEALNDSEAVIRVRAAEALWKVTHQAGACTPALALALKDRSALVRMRAADVLSRIGPEAKAAVPALIDALQDEYDEVRTHAILALGEIGPDAKLAVPALCTALRDADKGVQKAAGTALKKIDPEAAAKAKVR
jgi:HEAT repeat protein